MDKIFQQRKGQSAIEYLTTYGWMLLVIAIVGGAIFTTVQNQGGSVSDQSGFSDGDVRVDNFGVGSNGFQAEIRAATSEDITITDVTLNEGGDTTSNSSLNVNVPSTGTNSVTITDNVSSAEDTDASFTVTYDSGGLTGLTQEGTLSGIDVTSP